MVHWYIYYVDVEGKLITKKKVKSVENVIIFFYA